MFVSKLADRMCIPGDELGQGFASAGLQREVMFLLPERAYSEAFSQSLQARGQPAASIVAAMEPEGWRSMASEIALLVVDPALLLTTPGLLDTKQFPLLFLASRVKASWLEIALQCHASGFVTLNSPLAALLGIIEKLVSGELHEYWCPEAEQMLTGAGTKRKLATETVFSSLTRRQMEVLGHLAEGKTVKEVAQLMHLSQKSVDSHKYRIMNRLHIHDRVHLCRLAIREGLIEA